MPSTALAPSIGSTPGLAPAVGPSLDASSAKLDNAVQRYDTDVSTAHKHADERMDRIDAQHSDWEKANPKPAGEPPKTEPTSPVKQWGSTAMILAMLASAFTRRHADAALQAATGVLTAYQKADAVTAQKAFDTWKVQSENWYKAVEYENQMYARILAQSDRHEAADEREALARFNASAHAVQDQRMLDALAQGGLKHAEDLQLRREQLQINLQKANEQVAKLNAEMQGIYALQNDPEFKQAQADAKAGVPGAGKRIADMTAAAMPQHAAQIDQHVNSTINQVVVKIQGDPLAKQYEYNHATENTLASIEQYNRQHHGLDPYQAAHLKEAWTKNSLPGQAVRAFMTKMITDNTPYAFQARQAMDRLDSTDKGGMTEPQANLVLGMIQQFHEGLKTALAQRIEGDAQRVDMEWGRGGDIVRQTAVKGLDTDKYSGRHEVPKEHHPPPPAAIDYLRHHPDQRGLFDQKYGAGAAEHVLGASHGGAGQHTAGRPAPVHNVKVVLEGLFPGIHINDSYRPPSDPTGKPNDWHHKSHAAADVRPASLARLGITTFGQFIDRIRQAGYQIIESRDEATHPIPGVTTGPHWHVVLGLPTDA